MLDTVFANINKKIWFNKQGIKSCFCARAGYNQVRSYQLSHEWTIDH